MKAIVIHRFGGIETLEYTNADMPVAGEGEVLIHIKAAGVNPVDTKIREGLLQARMPNLLPVILGWDLAGIVVETGFSARRFKPGDQVYAYARRPVIHNGTYAEYIALPESYLALKPKNISFEEAASIPLSALTAYQCLFDQGKMDKNQHVLILGASGGVGMFAIQFAKICGATVYAVAGKGREAFLKSLGADFVMDYTDGPIHDQLKSILPLGADLVYDCVGKETTNEAYLCARKRGHIVSILTQPNETLMKKHDVIFNYVFVEPNAPQLDTIRGWIEQEKMCVKLQKIYALKEVALAHQQIETGHTQGKIVLKMPL